MITPQQARAELARRELARRGVSVNPPTPKPSAFERFGSALPVAGAIIGGLAGAETGPGAIGTAALGGAAGESFRQLIGRSIGQASPQTSAEAAKKIGVQGAYGAAQEVVPRVLGPIVKPIARPIMRGMGNMAAKATEAFTGLKAPDTLQIARQGLKTYFAPGMEKAQQIFGKALKSEGIAQQQPARQLFDPQLGLAKRIGRTVAEKLEKGVDISAEEALRARQATDRVIAATPLKDRATRGGLMALRHAFDDVLSNKSGALSKASKIYRQAIVKSNALNPLRITKQGQWSAVAPIASVMAGAATGGVTHEKGPGVGSMMAVLAGTSPALYGLAAATGGDLSRLATNPVVQRALVQAALRAYRNRQTGQEQSTQSPSQVVPQ